MAELEDLRQAAQAWIDGYLSRRDHGPLAPRAGDDPVTLIGKYNSAGVAFRVAFAGACFRRAAEAWRTHQEIAARLWPEPARELSEEMQQAAALQGWRSGEMERFAAAAAAERDGYQGNVLGLPELALQSRLAGLAFDAGSWAALLAAAIERSEAQLAKEGRSGAKLAALRALKLEGPVGRHLLWRGDLAGAASWLERALSGMEDWALGRARLYSDESKLLRAQKRDACRAFAALARGAAGEATLLSRRALLAAIQREERDESEELSFLHVLAAASSDPGDAAVAEFQASFPHLTAFLTPLPR